MKTDVDYSVYLVTDSELMTSETVERSVEEALSGGVTLVQLREKRLDSLEFYHQALRVKAVCAGYGVPLIVNDRVDIALAADADGVHVGQSDLPAALVRKLIGDGKILGVSATTLDEAVNAERDGADYIGVGAMFATPTKTDAKVVTKRALKEICDKVGIPVVMIGGINETTLLQFADCEIDGAAVVSAVVGQPDVSAAARKIRDTFFAGRRPVLRNKTAAIFDLDGTLLDSLGMWEEIDREFLGKRGISMPVDYAVKTAAMSLSETAKYTVSRFSLSDSPEELMKEWRKTAVLKYSSEIVLKPGAKEYLEELKCKGIRLAVATALGKEMYLPVLKRCGILNDFEQIFSAEDTGMEKRGGALFDKALAEMNLDPAETVLFEDAPDAVRSGADTGMYVVAVEDERNLTEKQNLIASAQRYIQGFTSAPIFKNRQSVRR